MKSTVYVFKELKQMVVGTLETDIIIGEVYMCLEVATKGFLGRGISTVFYNDQ